MEWLSLLVTIAVTVIISGWLVSNYILDFKRDLSYVALHEQSNMSTVRKENETAHYRNFLVPSGFPLTAGLGLSLGYRVRNGNFGDVWNAVMDLSNANSISFNSKSYSLSEINGMAKHILHSCFSKGDTAGGIGINVSPLTLEGFVISIAAMMGSLETNRVIPHLLASIPRHKMDTVDTLVLDSWHSYKMLNGSEHFWKLIIVCENSNEKAPKDVSDNVINFKQLIEGYHNDSDFKYTPPTDNSDDLKPFLNITSQWNTSTAFSHMNLVSSMAAFIKNFPADHSLTENDIITTLGYTSDVDMGLQMWCKTLAVLLHGGSARFLTDSETLSPSSSSPSKSLIDTLKSSTLLLIKSDILNKITKNIFPSQTTLFQSVKESWATTLLSEGIFTKMAQSNSNLFDSMRCIYLMETLVESDIISSFHQAEVKIPKLRSGQLKDTFSTTRLNRLRANFGSRLVVELYCPYIVIGPLSQTNFFDYRVFPQSLDTNFVCTGALSTSLEGKIIATDSNPNLDITKRQGMLCIRGFTIGKPIEKNRLENAATISKELANGEGWMPLVGVFGLWGQDGCLYLYK
ncbi:hypothetical protein KAFR_0J00450 [Kazachstania africana CBS 2517]|uniref:Uncharacterized protein n=1 Tax=Kazachstania africana (strain ATCC 22294 / BCRC 22015 / CBS 2517 / CECT 1963 / NBRC 1671 / NRRL Y-8276) TaxID=1071382 RepID=H2B0G3_KAZAF|nr:hypothetical protein KAFR_0J00450 [Kazachstania africana CBS 2517]CCF60113.1 hypothetical protein KAFR_0J00450 [Kazachstania africana CBS 2517]